jgi:nitroimidazol reductase NimA-like FMN-containing flavoprotein (pyridoxamine 5'-phosphate oxidase superfamily)
MQPDEIRAYLSGQRRIILVTNGPDGMPSPVPMNYGLDAEGRVLITSFRKSQKVKNLERDPRATLLVESGSGYHDLKAVIAYCEAEIIDRPDEVRALMRNVQSDDTMASSLAQPMLQQIESSIAKRVVLRFTPYRYVSWDHAKLGEVY